MSSPGAGKTTTLTKTIDAMKHDFRSESWKLTLTAL